MSLSTDSIARHATGAEGSRLGRDFVVLDPRGKMLRGFNATAARLWELLDGERSAQDISLLLAREFGAPGEQVRRDVLSFLSAMLDLGLVELVGGAAAWGDVP